MAGWRTAASALVLGAWCAVLLADVTTSADPLQQQSPFSAATKTRAFIGELRDRINVPALTVAVSMNGQIVASERVGWADVQRQAAVGPASLFRIGSLSKLLTATTALRLSQAGRLDLDAPIGRYLAGLPADKAAVTVRQIAGHLAGFRHYGNDDYINTTAYTNVSESLPRLLAMPLLSPPAAKYAYSSYGFNVLGAVIQAAAGKDYRQVVADEVLKPLAMTHTLAEESVPPLGRVTLYSRNPQNILAEASPSNLTDRWPSGGFLSIADDLARFGTGILQAGFLRTELRELAFTSQSAEGKDTNVGFAWRIARDAQGRRYVHHGGESVGGRGFLLVYPDQGISVALLSNVSFAAITEKEALIVAEFFLR